MSLKPHLVADADLDPVPSADPQDLLGLFMDYTDGVPTPDQFRRWSGISLIAGALERRVWIGTGRGVSYASLYVLLVAMPGVGKKVIEVVEELWQSLNEPGTSRQALRLAPHNVTKASFIDALVKAKQVRVPPIGQAMTYHALNIASEEFSVLMPNYDNEFINTFNKLWNNPANYFETRRTGTAKEVAVDAPMINLLAGYQPALMATTFPEEAWTSGWSRRLIMVYAGEPVFKDLFYTPPQLDQQRLEILRRLGQITQLFGEFKFNQEGYDYIKKWDFVGKGLGGPPIPTHTKLAQTYCRSRTELVVRLCLTSAVSRGAGLNGTAKTVTLADVKRSIYWLTEAERDMPDIFQAMTGRSDSQILDELHYYAVAQFGRRKNEPLPRSLLMRFLAERVPSDKIERVMAAALSAGYLDRMAGTGGDFGTDDSALYVPKARDDWGLR